jgi:type II secretory pathway component HofQ
VRIATTDKLRGEAAKRQALKQAQEQEVDPVTFTKVLSYAKVEDVAPILTEGVRSDRGRIVQDDRTNTLIITDVPAKRDAYQRLIDVLDTQLSSDIQAAGVLTLLAETIMKTTAERSSLAKEVLEFGIRIKTSE